MKHEGIWCARYCGAGRRRPHLAAQATKRNGGIQGALAHVLASDPGGRLMFKGSFTALITPFKNGQVDDQAFTRLVEWQIEEGTHGLVPVGTTGECPTLSHEEHKHVVELCIKAARKRVPVIAGAGSNSTSEAIDFTRHAKQAGADAVLHVTGYYN